MRSLRFALPFLLACVLFGCATTSHSSEVSRFQALDMSDSPAFVSLDQQLDALEKETSEVEADYRQIESQVVARIHFDDEQKTTGAPITIQLTSTNVIIMDANALSKNDLVAFAKAYLPERCAQPPRLVLEPGSDYDTAAWILEIFYGHGCANVDISE